MAFRILRGARARLTGVQVATPCPADWDAMEGDEKVRFCSQCRLHVYNLSAMDVEEAADRIAEHEGQLCVRFFRRADGSILTQDCPVGVERRSRRRRQAIGEWSVVLTGAVLTGSVFMPGFTQGAVARPAAVRAAMQSAAISGDAERLGKLLDQWAGLDSRSLDGRTLLMQAAGRGNLSVVKLLLGRGCRTDARDKQGRTALDHARQNGHAEVARLLAHPYPNPSRAPGAL